MTDKTDAHIISRRSVIRILGIGAAIGVAMPAVVLTGSEADAQTAGMVRRQSRRANRRDRREDRRDNRQARREDRRENRQDRREDRQDRRENRQENRQDRREDRRNPGL
jgi:membrane protein involved in colicin uptake